MTDHATRTSPVVLATALAGMAALALVTYGAREALGRGDGGVHALGALLGGFAGFALYHASFGFTGGWRRMVRERRGGGLRAQMLLISLACLVTYPLIGYEDATGWNMHPVILPMGLASALGAALFGAGMQLGGGCASGTLFTVGGGSTRMVVTLAAFIAGSVWATAHMAEFWLQLDEITGIPNLPLTSVIAAFGPLGGLAVLLAFAGAVALAATLVELRAHGGLAPARATGSLLRGPWSPTLGALALALVCIGCFLLFQRPWGVTAGFALWGAKALDALGVPVESWGYWSGWRAGQLEASLFADRTSVMNGGIVLGAMAAAALAGRFAPVWHLTRRELATAVIGGLMMGYGARLAFGCNIGAFLGGMVSGSLHGAWWLVWGFLGSMLGVRLRALLDMDPRPQSAPA